MSFRSTFPKPAKGRERQVFLQWYKIRELWFGYNSVEQNRLKAMQLAETCEHPEAQWLCGKSEVHVKGHQIYFASKINFTQERIEDEFDKKCIEQSALLDHPFGNVCFSMLCSIQRNSLLKFEHAEKAALQGDRDGMFCLAGCYYRGYGCVMDESKAIDLFYMSAKLGNIHAMLSLGSLLKPVDDASGSYWIGKAFYYSVVKDPDLYKYYEYRRYYMHQLNMYRKMVDTWTLVGMRCNVVKDVRIMIARKIWKQRKYVEAPAEERGIVEHVFNFIKNAIY